MRRPLVSGIARPIVIGQSGSTTPPPPPPPPPPTGYTETAASLANNSLLDYGGGIAAASSRQAMLFASFEVPATPASTYAPVLQFGFGSYIRINRDLTLSIVWGGSQFNLLPGLLRPGMRVNMLVALDTAGNRQQVVAKINSGAPIILRDNIATGTVGFQNQLRIGNDAPLSKDFIGALYRIVLWDGITPPDLTDPAVQAAFFNSNGSLVAPAAARIYGAPVVELDGPDILTGANTGTGTDFAVTGTITAGAPVPAFAISVEEPLVDRFGHALNLARTAATVPVQGYFAGPDRTIHVRARDRADGSVVVGWTPIGPQTGGIFSGQLSVPAGDRLVYFEVSDSAQAVTAAQATSWTTALRVLMYGQSNTVRAFDPGLTPREPASALTLPPTCLGVWVQTAGLGFTTDLSDGAEALAHELNRLTGLPVMVLQGGTGGQSIGNLAPPAVLFTDMLAGLAALGGLVHAIAWHQGESDVAGALNPANLAAYAADLGAIHAGIAAAVGLTVADIPLVLSSLGVSSTTNDDEWAAFKAFQRAGLPGLPNVHYVGPWNDEVLSDQYHSYGLAYERRCLRDGLKLAAVLGHAPDPGQFHIAGATALDATTTELVLAHGPGSDWEIVTVTHLGGTGAVDPVLGAVGSFAVSGDGGSSWIPATPGVEVAPDRITLSHAAIATAGRRLRYFHGTQPTGIVRDTSGYGWPLECESDMAVG